MLYIKNGIIRDESRIVIVTDEYLVTNPTEEMILADGWVKYDETNTIKDDSVEKQLRDMLLDEYNKRTDLTDEQALSRPLLIFSWYKYINGSLKANQLVGFSERIYRVKQDINVVLEDQYPSLSTAALYEVVELQATGAIDDPIAYVPPMEIFQGKYYTQSGVLYKCTRDSGQALSHDLSALVGVYVEAVVDESPEGGDIE